MSNEGLGSATGGSKMRIYELAKELSIANRDLVEKVRAIGIEAKNHMSTLEADDVARVRRSLEKDRQSNLVEERLTAGVIRRRSRDGAPVRPAPPVPTVVARPVVEGRSEPAPRRAAVEEPRPRLPAVEVRPEAEVVRPSTPPPVVEAEPGPAPAISEPPPVVEPAPIVEVVPEPTPEPRLEPPPVVEVKPEPKPQPKPQPRIEPPPVVEARPPVVEARPVQVESRPPVVEQRRPEPRAAGEPIVEFKSHAPGRVDMPANPADATGAGMPLRQTDMFKYGATGRVIDLAATRPPVFKVQEVGPPGGRTTRDLQKRDLSGRDRFARQQPQQGKKKVQPGKKAKATVITTPAAHKRIIKMDETIGVAEIAKQMGIKATDVLKKLWSLGLTGINLLSSIDQDSAGLVASEFGYEIENVAFQESAVFAEEADNEEDLQPRPPVVTIMGHVDHGKTSLLDAIRDANVAAGEAGGITQHIGAYKVQTGSGREVVFLDTPGHEAFTAMRARGAQATDIVVLVVAADDGVMPQTVEAVHHAKSAEVPIVVAVNKIDKPSAQPDRIRQQLSDYALVPEQWGGETIYVDVSARTHHGVDTLLEMLALQADVLELRANPNKLAKGVVIEAKLDRNRGPVATVLVQDGTLKTGDTVVAGEQMGKVRAMLDDKGRNLGVATPSTPVEILGLSGVPNAGDTFNAATDEKSAKELVEHRRDQRRKKDFGGTAKVSLENILEKIQKGEVKELRVVLKADVQGSAEALKEALVRLSTEQVKVEVISAGVGGITETDVNLAKAGGAIIVGFHVRPAGKAANLAEQEQVDIKLYEIIYEALDDVKKAMAGLLAPVKREKFLGKAEIRQTFTIPKIGTIAGCGVSEGTIKRSAHVRLVRDSVVIFTGRISSLRRFKDDVREVQQGYECGLSIENYNDLKVGDVVEAFEIEEIAPTL